MKKSLVFSFMVTMLSVAAYAAEPAPLATTNYVDTGLRAVYNKASIRMDAMETTIGDENSGLVKKVNELDASSQTYASGDGIDISVDPITGDGVISVEGLSTTKTEENADKIYVYKNGELIELETATSDYWTE